MPTIGVAVAVPDPWGARLQTYRRALGDPGAVGIPTHVTLVPPTEVATDELAAVAQHLTGAAAESDSFEVTLRGTGSFRPVSPVVFVALAEGISGCEQLAARIRTAPLDVELHFPYHPHVTVAHGLDDELLERARRELADFECRFFVDEFHLYVHDDDRGWQPHQTFSLR